MDSDSSYLQPYRNNTIRTRGSQGSFPKLTLFRLLVVLSTAVFGFSKAWLSYRGESTAPTTLDWLYGVLVFALLYWMGIYERETEHNMPWLFDEDFLGPLKPLFRSDR